MQTSKIILANKKINLNLLSKKLILPKRIQDKIDRYWEGLLKNEKKYTRGRVFSAVDIKEEKKEIRIDFVLTDYAHYLYSSNVGLPKKYACKNVHTSCLIETTDNVLIFGRMGKNTSRAGIIQCIGGGLDEEDIFGKKIDLKHNMEKELFEEVGIDFRDEKIVDSLSHEYIKHSQKINSVAMIFILKLKITAKQFKKHYAKFEKELKKKKMLPEFGELIYLPKERKALENFLQTESNSLPDHYMEVLLRKVTV